ncbi:ABC transporter substrate binding protein [Sulfurimonas sp.]
MKILFTLALFILNLYADKVLILNSNANIEKYKSVQEEFIKNTKKPYKVLDIEKLSQKEIKEYLYDEYPDIVYTIGSKAYRYANVYIPEKTIFFSSIVNHKRLDIGENRYGISNELHSGMNLTIIKSLFHKTQTLSLIYSDYTKDLFENYKSIASKIGIKVIGEKIKNDGSIEIENMQQTDGLILIADPLLLNDEQRVMKLFEYMKKIRKPIFAYHDLYIKLGASLVVSADNPTIGRQIAYMMQLYNDKKEFIKIQIPMGTNVIFNKKMVESLGINYDVDALSVVNKVIE